jgi:hypothetical protein
MVSETRTKGKPHRRRIAWRLGEVIEIIPETPGRRARYSGERPSTSSAARRLLWRRWQLLWSTWDMTLRA